MSRHEKFVSELGTRYGPENVKVCTAHHIQVKIGNRTHNIWLPENGGFKILLHGQRGRARFSSHADRVFKLLGGANSAPSDKDKMETARFTHLVSTAIGAFCEANETNAVFVDASWKRGLAKIAVVKIARVTDGLSMEAVSVPMKTKTSSEAEGIAITMAMQRWPDYPIYSDCKGEVTAATKRGAKNINWVRRDKNKLADKLSKT